MEREVVEVWAAYYSLKDALDKLSQCSYYGAYALKNLEEYVLPEIRGI